MLQIEVPGSKNMQNAELSMAVRLFHEIGFFKRNPVAWDFRVKTRIFRVSLHFLRFHPCMFQNGAADNPPCSRTFIWPLARSWPTQKYRLFCSKKQHDSFFNVG